MTNKHILTIFLIDGSKEIYTFICENNIDSIKTSLMKEVADEGVYGEYNDLLSDTRIRIDEEFRLETREYYLLRKD